MTVTDDPRTLLDVLEEAKRITYRLVAIVEVLEHDLGITPEEDDDA